MTEYVVALIFSNWSLSKIYSFFSDYLNNQNEIGCVKIERYKDRKTGGMKDSNRTLMLMKRSLFERALEAGLEYAQPNLDFRITEYRFNMKNYPALGYSSNFFILIPREMPASEAEVGILKKMKTFVEFEILNRRDFNIRTPLESRITGEHRGYMYLTFDGSVTLNTKLLIKELLNDSFLYLMNSKKLYHVPVFWAKDIQTKPSKWVN